MRICHPDSPRRGQFGLPQANFALRRLGSCGFATKGSRVGNLLAWRRDHEILARLEKGTKDTFVFAPYVQPEQWNKKVRRRLITHMRAIGIPEFTHPHWLRHTFISWLAMAGMPKESIKDIVGHVDDETFEIYRHTTQEHKKGLLDALDLDL